MMDNNKSTSESWWAWFWRWFEWLWAMLTGRGAVGQVASKEEKSEVKEKKKEPSQTTEKPEEGRPELLTYVEDVTTPGEATAEKEMEEPVEAAVDEEEIPGPVEKLEEEEEQPLKPPRRRIDIKATRSTIEGPSALGTTGDVRQVTGQPPDPAISKAVAEQTQRVTTPLSSAGDTTRAPEVSTTTAVDATDAKFKDMTVIGARDVTQIKHQYYINKQDDEPPQVMEVEQEGAEIRSVANIQAAGSVEIAHPGSEVGSSQEDAETAPPSNVRQKMVVKQKDAKVYGVSNIQAGGSVRITLPATTPQSETSEPAASTTSVTSTTTPATTTVSSEQKSAGATSSVEESGVTASGVEESVADRMTADDECRPSRPSTSEIENARPEEEIGGGPGDIASNLDERGGVTPVQAATTPVKAVPEGPPEVEASPWDTPQPGVPPSDNNRGHSVRQEEPGEPTPVDAVREGPPEVEVSPTEPPRTTSSSDSHQEQPRRKVKQTMKIGNISNSTIGGDGSVGFSFNQVGGDVNIGQSRGNVTVSPGTTVITSSTQPTDVQQSMNVGSISNSQITSGFSQIGGSYGVNVKDGNSANCPSGSVEQDMTVGDMTNVTISGTAFNQVAGSLTYEETREE